MSEISVQQGIPAELKEWFESLSGYSFDDVRVHYNSDMPERLGVPAYTCSGHVYIAPGQEHCLAHELVHVIQQKQGRVKSSMRFREDQINISKDLEVEADSFYDFSGQ